MKIQAKMLLLGAVVLLGPLARQAMADEAPSWDSFKVCTGSKRYCGEVARAVTEGHPWRAYHKLTVWEDKDGQRRELWSQPYKHDGYAGGIVAPDGSSFVHVSAWYQDGTVLSIYREDRRMEVPGSDFQVPEASLEHTESHQLWLAAGEKPCEYIANDTLSVRTRGGRTHRVDLKTGELKP